MSNEKVIMGKDDYHEVCNVVKTLRRINKDYAIEGGLIEIDQLLDKVQSYEVSIKMNGGTIIVYVSDYNRLCEMVNNSITYLPFLLKNTATEQLNVIVNRYKKAQPYEEDN